MDRGHAASVPRRDADVPTVKYSERCGKKKGRTSLRPFFRPADQSDPWLEERLGRQQVSPAGLVRVGRPVAAALFAAQRLPNLLQCYPGLSVDLVVDDERHGKVD